MEKSSVALILGALVVTCIGIGFVVSLNRTETPSVGALGTPNISQHATTSTIVVGPQSITTIFTAKNLCAERVFGTPANSGSLIVLSFDPNIAPSASAGFPFTASTTNSLPSELYGCGAVRAYAAASTTITRSEFIW